MAAVWIVHREAPLLGALARLAGVGPDAVVGAPTDTAFRSAGRPDLVVLGLAGDFERELEFAHDQSVRHPDAEWILLAGPRDAAEVRRLFDTLPAQVLDYPAEAPTLRRHVRAAQARRRAASLSERRARDAVATRFDRWFADLELPSVLRALDPQLADVPLLVRGEPGTGRSLLASYVHAFGGSERGHLAQISCQGLGPEALRSEIATAAAAPAARNGLSLCLEDVELLPLASQRRLRGWMERGLPEGVAGPPGSMRWIATCSELGPDDPCESLDLGLAQVLAGLEVRIPPLRERPEALEPFVSRTVLAWSHARGEAPGRFARGALRALAAYPWPGNLRELEAVVSRTLAAGCGEVVAAPDLRFDGAGEWPDPVVAPAEESDLEDALASLEVEEPAPSGGEHPYLADVEPLARPESGTEPFEPEPIVTADPEPTPTAQLVPEPIVTAEPEPLEAEPAVGVEPEAPVGVRPPDPAGIGPPDPGGVRPPDLAHESIRRLVGAVSHEVRNPLVAIRTFSALLPERFEDPDFRGRFAGIVGDDVRRIERAVERLAHFATLGPPERKAVDVSGLLDELLEARREEIQTRRLVVLRELDRERGLAQGDEHQLRFAFEALIEKALELVPERGDVYVASRHHADGLRGEPAVRVLLRFESPDEEAPTIDVEGLSVSETSLDLVLAEAVIQAAGGTLTVGSSDAQETVILIDLPA